MERSLYIVFSRLSYSLSILSIRHAIIPYGFYWIHIDFIIYNITGKPRQVNSANIVVFHISIYNGDKVKFISAAPVAAVTTMPVSYGIA